jgi:GNAT superfamily N-acetyltransferase/heme-degrading monooxygenase HmoA
MMHHVSMWEFRVRDGRTGEFLQHYGPGGTWERIFRRAPGYLGTELLRNDADPCRFVTLDRWTSRAALAAFRQHFAKEYADLDRQCAACTTTETELGAFAGSSTAAFERRRGEFTISTDIGRFDFDAIHAALVDSYWATGVPRAVVEKSAAHSLCFGLFTPDLQIGFARMVTDRATYAYLADVYVLEEFRGRGLGTWLVETVLAHPELQGLRRFALVTRDAHALYARFGFQALANPARHMEIAYPAAQVYRAGGSGLGPEGAS